MQIMVWMATARNKKRFAAQQVLTLLGSLAHTVCIWVHRWVSPAQLCRRYDLKRMVRNLFQVAVSQSLTQYPL